MSSNVPARQPSDKGDKDEAGELPELNDPEIQLGSSEIATFARFEAYSGPLPHPDLVRQYEEIFPGASEQFFQMLREETQHRRDLENREFTHRVELERDQLRAQIEYSKGEQREKRRGQYIGGLIALSAFVVTTVLAYLEQPWPAVVFGSSGIAGLVSVFVIGRRHEETSSRTEDEEEQEEEDAEKRST